MKTMSLCRYVSSLVLFLAVVLGSMPAAYAITPQGTPLAGSAIPQFVDPLPSLHTIIAGAAQIELDMTEFQSNVMPSSFVPATGTYTGTWAWSYHQNGQAVTADTSYIGPVIVATRGTPTEIRYVNNLGSAKDSNVLFWANATDQTLHWADPLGMMGSFDNYTSTIPAVPHLHGGEVPPVLDGGPDQWFTSDGNYHGHTYYTQGFAGDVMGLPTLPDAGYPTGAIVFNELDNTRYINVAETWEVFTSNAAVFRYPNLQEAAPLWFHDHLLGATRLNVYAGLAGAYVLTDPALNLPTDLPGPANIIPLVIQDRKFDTEGQLFFDIGGINPEHPEWIPEFVGDTIVVNGKVWPYLDLEPRRYRFLLINGSNARPYEMSFIIQDGASKAMGRVKPDFFTRLSSKGPAIWQIATDGGYLDVPVLIDPNAKPGSLSKLLILPGERAEIIVDFSAFAGQTLLLTNTARTPFPDGDPVDPLTTGRIVQVRVGAAPVVDSSYDPSSGTPLRTGEQEIVRLVNPATGTLAAGVTADVTRQLTLNEVMGMGGPLDVLLNNTGWAGRQMDGPVRDDFTPLTSGGDTEYLSELPDEGTTEVWEIVNLTADAHPIHLHLVQFQVLNRQGFNFSRYNKAYEKSFPGGAFMPAYGPPLDYNTGNARALGGNPDIVPYLQDGVTPPNANEAGWKDTAVMYPGQVTRIAVRFAPTSEAIDSIDLFFPFEPNVLNRPFVWHCHIIDHEDNEMMRPYTVVPDLSAIRTYNLGTDY